MELLQFFKGFIRSYATLMFFKKDKTKKVTDREVGFFAKLGEMLGFHVFQEEQLEINGNKKFCDLVWANYNPNGDQISYILHLESENELSAEETIETKLSDTPNLIAIVWDNPRNYSHLVEITKRKIEKSNRIKNVLLIIQKKIKDRYLLTGIQISKINGEYKIKKCEGLLKVNEAGFFYGLLKEDISESKWLELTGIS